MILLNSLGLIKRLVLFHFGFMIVAKINSAADIIKTEINLLGSNNCRG